MDKFEIVNLSRRDFLKAGAGLTLGIAAPAAAGRWSVAPESITVARGVVTHPSGRKATFGQLAAGAAKLPVPQEVKLKDAKDFAYIGRHTPRTDSRAKSTGTAVFTQDLKLP